MLSAPESRTGLLAIREMGRRSLRCEAASVPRRTLRRQKLRLLLRVLEEVRRQHLEKAHIRNALPELPRLSKARTPQ